MITLIKHIARLLASVRNLLFLALFLLHGNFHQAVEKPGKTYFENDDYYYLFERQVNFNPDYLAYMERSLDSLLQRNRFNGSVLVAHQGSKVYNKSFGYASFIDSQEFDQQHNIFQLASVGKQFTAVAILMLHERGALHIDDTVARHIPNFPYENITVRQLLNHTSGIQNYFYLIDNYWKEERLPTYDDVLEFFNKRSLPLNFTPGRRFSYSNTGYVFLAMLVETVTGISFADFVRNHIFNPLGMNHSFVLQSGAEEDIALVEGQRAIGHERRGRFLRPFPIDFNDGVSGDKGIFSCTEDLLTWYNAIESNRLISEETRQMAFERGVLSNGYAISYGFGYRIRRQANDEENIIYHNGWWKGFRTAYVKLPDNTLLVILNNTTASLNGLENRIRKIIDNSPYPIISEPEETPALAMKS